MRKKITFIIVSLLLVNLTISAQYDFGFRITPEAGMILKSNKDNRLGVGGTISLIYFINSYSSVNSDAVTLGLKGFNNPWHGGKIVSSILNGKADAFNYLSVLAGYQKRINHYFIEPRIGIAKGSNYDAFIFSPQIGYTHENFDFGCFVDFGIGSKKNAIGSKNFSTLGLSIGYTFPF